MENHGCSCTKIPDNKCLSLGIYKRRYPYPSGNIFQLHITHLQKGTMIPFQDSSCLQWLKDTNDIITIEISQTNPNKKEKSTLCAAKTISRFQQFSVIVRCNNHCKVPAIFSDIKTPMLYSRHPNKNQQRRDVYFCVLQ